MANSISDGGRKIKGFFGLFDVLGYSKMIETMKDNLEGLISIYTTTLMNIDEKALSLEGYDKFAIFAVETKSFAFSDTIVLYQDMPKGPVALQTMTINFFLGKVCYLLRLAFELGIPLRGAVSYGEYYIKEDKSCFIGYPAIEAHIEEAKQNWSGATLCESAWKKLYELHNESMGIQEEDRGIDLRGAYSPLRNPFWEKYPIPYYDNKNDKSYSNEGIALCWHDAVLDSMHLDRISRISTFDLENIGQFVKAKFEAHGKTIDINDYRTRMKIKNTADFLGTMQMRYSLGLAAK